MYCKYCGKIINDDSSFCQYCGGEQDVSFEKDNKQNSTDIIVSTINNDPLKIEVSKEKKVIVKDSTIANEILGNLKVMGLAITLLFTYIICFVLFHLKDIKKYDYETHKSYLGESCYDNPYVEDDAPSFHDDWMTFLPHWEQHYYKMLEECWDDSYDIRADILSPKECLEKAKDLESRLMNRGCNNYYFPISKSDIKEMKKQAKEDAANDVKEWNSRVNKNRKDEFLNNLKRNASYVALISLVLSIIGRYLSMLAQWVKLNKTS